MNTWKIQTISLLLYSSSVFVVYSQFRLIKGSVPESFNTKGHWSEIKELSLPKGSLCHSHKINRREKRHFLSSLDTTHPHTQPLSRGMTTSLEFFVYESYVWLQAVSRVNCVQKAGQTSWRTQSKTTRLVSFWSNTLHVQNKPMLQSSLLP